MGIVKLIGNFLFVAVAVFAIAYVALYAYTVGVGYWVWRDHRTMMRKDASFRTFWRELNSSSEH